MTYFKFRGPVHISGMAETRICTQVGYIKSYQKNEKLPRIWAWSWSHDLFKFLVFPMISPEPLKLETSNFVHWFTSWRISIGITNCPFTPLIGCGCSHVTSLNYQK